MTGITVPVVGSSGWGPVLNAALEDLQDNGLIANDAAFQSWNYPPFNISIASSAITSGTVVMMKLPSFVAAKTINSVQLHVTAVAVTPTAGQCFAGIYNAAGTRMGVSADVGSTLTAGTGLQSFPLTAPVACPAGDYWVALLQNAATPATLGVSSGIGSSSALNAGLSAASAFFTTGPTAQTSLPANITMASRTLAGQAWWAGVK